jgi:hypothetical protein
MSQYTDTYDLLDIADVKIGSKLHKLLLLLNTETCYSSDTCKDSIMTYGNICTCDDGWLCEHRLNYIKIYIIEHFIERD